MLLLHRLKRAVAILLCLCLMVQVVAHHVVVGLFQLNRDHISKSLCENRNKPAKKCNGKCYLKKQLKKVDDTEHGSSNAPTLKIEKTEVVCLLPVSIQFSARECQGEPVVQNPVLLHFSSQSHLQSIFHPPAVFC